MSKKPKLPWRANGLDGFGTSEGPTFNGGTFVGGGPRRDRSLTVRLLIPMGRPASVELDLTDGESHGCSVSLPPATAREAAAALLAAAERAEAEMAHWQSVLDQQNAQLEAARQREIEARAGVPREEPAA